MSPVRNCAATIEELVESETTPKRGITQATNIQSQYVVINNYNSYTCPVPSAMPPGIPIPYTENTSGYNYGYYQPLPPVPYMPYYYPSPQPFVLQPQNVFVPMTQERKLPMEEQKSAIDVEKLLNKVELAVRDQSSCRLLQTKLDEGNKEVVNKIFSQLIGKIGTHMNDSFGNYLCQKLFEHCSAEQIKMVIENISANAISIAKNIHGTRSIQKVIEMSINKSDLLEGVVGMLKTGIASLVMVF